MNLLLNRADASCDIHSHIPCRGQVDVTGKQLIDLDLRLPEWVQSWAPVRVVIDGATRVVSMRQRYVIVGTLKPKQKATISFPIDEQETEIQVERRRYVLVRRGNEVVSIDPPGRHHPLYQRDHLREERTLWVEQQRFVAERAISWGPA